MKTHKDLKVWQLSMEMVTNIYTLTKEFPQEEIYGITSQIRKAAVSVPSNIAEGATIKSKTDNIRFLNYAIGSLAELDTQIIISYNIGYISIQIKNKIETIITQILKMLSGLINFLKQQSIH